MLFHLERDKSATGDDHFRDVQMLAGHAALEHDPALH